MSKASSKKDIQDQQILNNVFNIYCLRKKCKNGIYTHTMLLIRKAPNTHEPQQKNTDVNHMRLSIDLYIQQSLFEWLKS